jgi:hypothetical protein
LREIVFDDLWSIRSTCNFAKWKLKCRPLVACFSVSVLILFWRWPQTKVWLYVLFSSHIILLCYLSYSIDIHKDYLCQEIEKKFCIISKAFWLIKVFKQIIGKSLNLHTKLLFHNLNHTHYRLRFTRYECVTFIKVKIHLTFCYVIVYYQHCYFNNKENNTYNIYQTCKH